MVKQTFYTTLEKQVYENGGHNILFDQFTDYNAALAKLYTVLAAAAISEIPYHAGFILRDDGVITDGKVFDRRTVPNPEPEE